MLRAACVQLGTCGSAYMVISFLASTCLFYWLLQEDSCSYRLCATPPSISSKLHRLYMLLQVSTKQCRCQVAATRCGSIGGELVELMPCQVITRPHITSFLSCFLTSAKHIALLFTICHSLRFWCRRAGLGRPMGRSPYRDEGMTSELPAVPAKALQHHRSTHNRDCTAVFRRERFDHRRCLVASSIG